MKSRNLSSSCPLAPAFGDETHGGIDRRLQPVALLRKGGSMFTRVMIQCMVIAGVVLGLLGLPGGSALPGPAQGAPASTLRALDRQIDSMLARKKQQKKKKHCKKKHHKKKHHKKKKKSSKMASAAVNR
jgi:hypothetical protein